MTISNKHKMHREGTEINVWVLDFKTGNHVMWHDFMESKGPFWIFYLFFLNTNGEPTNTASNVTNSSSYELIFRHVFMSHICPNLFPCGPLHGDLLNHLQLRMTLIPISSPHLIHLSRALHCLSLAFKWQWYIRHITETKGRQGPSFYSALNQKKKWQNLTPLWRCIKNSRDPGILSAPSLTAASRDLAGWGVCKDPIKMHYRKWDLVEPCEKPCM